jgi:hypothetical protein
LSLGAKKKRMFESPQERSYAPELTVFDSPVILDSSIAREWPDIRIPSAGT